MSEELREKERLLNQLALELNTEPEQLPLVIGKFKREIRDAEAHIKELKKELK